MPASSLLSVGFLWLQGVGAYLLRGVRPLSRWLPLLQSTGWQGPCALGSCKDALPELRLTGLAFTACGTLLDQDGARVSSVSTGGVRAIVLPGKSLLWPLVITSGSTSGNCGNSWGFTVTYDGLLSC